MNLILEKCTALELLHRTFLEKFEKIEKKLEKIEAQQLIILGKINRHPKKCSIHIPQNIGCVRTSKNFKQVNLHKTRVARIEFAHRDSLIDNLEKHYGCFLVAFLREPQNQSFYRPSRQHNYVYSSKRGWEEERASYLLHRLEIISLNYFKKYMKKLRPDFKIEKFTIKKSLLIRKLTLCKDQLRESKCRKTTVPD